MSVETQARPSPAQIRELLGLSPDRLFVVVSRLFALGTLVIVLSLLSPHFLSWGNIVNVLRQAVPLFVMSAGLTLVVLTAGIDLSVGAVLGLAACVAASMITGGSPVMGVLAALCVGLGCGLINGALVAYARIPSFIATYGMLWIANGMAYVFMKGEVIYGLPAGFRQIGTGMIGPIPVPIFVLLATLSGSPCTASPHATWPRHIRHWRQPGGGAAVGHAGRTPARHRLRAERAHWRHLPA